MQKLEELLAADGLVCQLLLCVVGFLTTSFTHYTYTYNSLKPHTHTHTPHIIHPHTTYYARMHTHAHTHTHTHTTQDEFVEYHHNHNTFPADIVTLPKRLWPDLVVLFWLSLLGIPAFLTGLYLAWVGAWFTLALIILAVILGEFSYCWIC